VALLLELVMSFDEYPAAQFFDLSARQRTTANALVCSFKMVAYVAL